MRTFSYPAPRKNRRSGGKLAQIEAAVLEELDEIEGPTTVRLLYYRLVARGVLRKEDKRGATYVSEVLTDLRLSGVVPFERIVDRARSTYYWETWGSIAEGAKVAVSRLRLDPWQGQPTPQVWVESESLAGLLERLAYEYGVPLFPLRGQASTSYVYELAQGIEPDTPILYLGDLDKSGVEIEAAATARAEAFAGFPLDVRRLAVTEAQVEKYRLPIIDKLDKRTKPPRTFPAVETEALGQERIVAVLRNALEAFRVDLAAVDEKARQQRAVLLNRLFDQDAG